MDTDKERFMLSKSDKTEITINDKADETRKELFESHLSRYQIGLEKTMKDSHFLFDYVYFYTTNANFLLIG